MKPTERVEAMQGLTLATLCDILLGENAADRSDNALIRAAADLKRQVEELKRREKIVLSPSYVEPSDDGNDRVMTEAVKNYVFQLRDKLAEATKEMVRSQKGFEAACREIAENSDYTPRQLQEQYLQVIDAETEAQNNN